MASNQVSVEITLEEKAALSALTKLTKEIQKTETGFTKLGKEGDEALGLIDQASTGVTTGFKTLVSGVTIANLASSAILGTANAIKGFAVDSVNAAIEAEESTNNLTQALKAAGAFSEQAVSDFQAYATELSKLSVFSDDAIVAQIALAKSMGASNEQAKLLVKAAAELSATFGGSLESRVQQLGKTLQGTGGKLDTLIPGFKKLTEEQLKLGQGVEFVNTKFDGNAAAQIDTYGGKLAQLTKSVGELQESIGKLVVQSGVSNLFGAVASAADLFTQAIADGEEAVAKRNGTFVESASSVEKLAAQYASLTTRLELAQAEEAKLNQNANFFEKAFGFGEAATKKVGEFRSELAALEAQINKAAGGVAAAPAPEGTDSTTGTGISPADQKLVDSRLAAYEQLKIAEVEYAAYQAEQSILNTEITAENYQAELDQLIGIEQAKIDAKFSAEEQKAGMIKDSQTQQLSLQKLSADKELAIDKSKVDAKKKLDDLQLKQQQDSNKATLSDEQAFYSAANSLATSENKSLAAIGIAAGLAQIARDTPPAVMSSYKFGAGIGGPVLGATFGAIAAAAGAAQAAKLAGMKFEYGGIVKGNAMTGDGIQARVNSGEMILNRQQQTELFNVANGGGAGGGELINEIKALRRDIASQPINLTVDGRALATVIRGEVRGGFKLN